MKTESKVLSIVAGFASAVGAAFATAASQLQAASLQAESGSEPSSTQTQPSGAIPETQASTGPTVQVCLRGDTAHFQVGEKGNYKKFDRSDLTLSDRASIRNAIEAGGLQVTTSMYGSQTKYVKLQTRQGFGHTKAILPNGKAVVVPQSALA